MRDADKTDAAIRALHETIMNPGRSVDYHFEVLHRHRREWPMLWEAIDLLLDANPHLTRMRE